MKALVPYALDGTEALPVPRVDLSIGALVEFGARGSEALRVLRVVRRAPRKGTTPSRVEFHDVEDGMPTAMDDVQIAMACRDGEFRIVQDGDGNVIVHKRPLIEQTPDDDARRARCKAYVDACAVEPPCRSRAGLVPLIAALAAKRGEKPPGFTTVLSWIDVWETQSRFVGDACFLKERNQGHPWHRLKSDLIAKAVDRGVLGSFTLKKGGGADALAIAKEWLAENHPNDVADEEDWPGVRTFQYRRAALDRYVADGLQFGWGYAARKHTVRYARPRPELPLMEVECDHTPMDVLVVDETSGIVFGRPDLVAFRDRCTGTCLGFSIGFDRAGYTAFLAGLKHAMYPKHMGEYPGLAPWFAYGRFGRLYVDNGLHFIGHNIRRAAESLGFQIAEFLPGEPWLKGAEEKLLGLINKEVHELPGGTFSNIVERKLHEELAGKPVVTIAQLRAFVTAWFCNEWNITEHEGLGLLDTLKGVPRDLWFDKIEKVRSMPLPEETDFIALAGDSDLRCVTPKGIRWDNVRYQAPCLSAIRRHPDHRDGRERDDRAGREHHGTKYLVKRDPQDIGRIHIINPYEGGRAFEVQAIRQDYAAGLTLHQHQVIVRNANQKLVASRGDPETELLRVRAIMAAFVAKLMTDRKVKGVQQKLAAFVGEAGRRHERSVVHTETQSRELSREPMNPRAPAPMAPPVDLSPDAARPTAARPPATGTEDESFETGAGLPERIDRGVAIAEAMRARTERIIDDARSDEQWDTDDDLLARTTGSSSPSDDDGTAAGGPGTAVEATAGSDGPVGAAVDQPTEASPTAPRVVADGVADHSVGHATNVPEVTTATEVSRGAGAGREESPDDGDGTGHVEAGRASNPPEPGPTVGAKAWVGSAGFPVNPDGEAWDEE